MNVLVLNAGSSTLKFQLIATDLERIAEGRDERLARGMVDRIGGHAVITLESVDGEVTRDAGPVRDLAAAFDQVVRWLTAPPTGTPVLGSIGEIDAVGHRVVHGGERFDRSVLIDATVRGLIEEAIELAPLHNPHNLRVINAARAVLGDGVPQAAVFDTSFHSTIPDYAYLYGIPYPLYRKHRLRRYGFHGTSHRYVAHRYRELTGASLTRTRLVTIHLGNGCSACAIADGRSVDTSMGFTPLEGLIMGTRSGDLDPAIVEFLALKEGMSISEIDTLLNRQSGLLGISGLSHDMRDLLAEAREHDDRRANLAIRMFAYRVTKYVGAYLAALNGADAIVFTGGIGENAADVRTLVCEALAWMGLHLDASRNEAAVDRWEGRISTDDSRLACWVIPTDEELLIARDTVRLVLGEESSR